MYRFRITYFNMGLTYAVFARERAARSAEMNTTQALAKWEDLEKHRQKIDKIRTYYERIAENDPDRREYAESMRDKCNEMMYRIYQDMVDLEAYFADSLHHAAEIVNGLALVLGWRE